MVDAQGTEVLEVDRALARLAEIDSRKARIVELRYFGGLTADEAAEVLGISPVTIHRQWLLARTWLHRELGRAASLDVPSATWLGLDAPDSKRAVSRSRGNPASRGRPRDQNWTARMPGEGLQR